MHRFVYTNDQIIRIFTTPSTTSHLPCASVRSPSTLRMRGVPFRATIDDIVRFFGGFQTVPGGVIIGQRDGRASGEAWVTFANPAEAQRAMAKNNTHMGSRYIELFAA